MNRIAKPAPFVLVSTGHGSMIANVHDYRPPTATEAGIAGVGGQLFRQSLFDPVEIDLALYLLSLRKEFFGPGVVALDCGANIGVHAIEWARHMTGWGTVTAIEAQERIYYALAGNIALNNCFNASALHAAIGGELGQIMLPVLNYAAPASFGSLELRKGDGNEAIGQPVDYDGAGRQAVSLLSIDHFQSPRLDFIKMDIEGMELEALGGAFDTLKTCRPMLMLEHIKAQPGSLQDFIGGFGYHCITLRSLIVAVHQSDPGLPRVQEALRGLEWTG